MSEIGLGSGLVESGSIAARRNYVHDPDARAATVATPLVFIAVRNERGSWCWPVEPASLLMVHALSGADEPSDEFDTPCAIQEEDRQ
jgi:hypothetical protein